MRKWALAAACVLFPLASAQAGPVGPYLGDFCDGDGVVAEEATWGYGYGYGYRPYYGGGYYKPYYGYGGYYRPRYYGGYGGYYRPRYYGGYGGYRGYGYGRY